MIVEKSHHGERIKRLDAIKIRIGFNNGKPNNLYDFRHVKYQLGRHYHPPALFVGYPKSKHETPHPDHESDNQELPQVD
jgi:hypothetical protein